MASSSQANSFVSKLLRFRAKHSGVSNPSLDLSYRVSGLLELLSSLVLGPAMNFHILDGF